MDAPKHTPVLLRESVDGLNLSEGNAVVDCTTGLGGHTREILSRIGSTGRVLCIDRDPEMLKTAQSNLASHASQLTFVHANFADLGIIAPLHGFSTVHGVIADLGICSRHVDDPARGFSFQGDGPLDMRFDPLGGRESAREVLATRSVEELTEIFRTYGEERFAHRIANKIVFIRKQKEIQTTRELAEVVASCVPTRKQKLHPATRVFQALRVYINDELGALTRMIRFLPDVLVPGGRVVIISYHSLEDRIVKQSFKQTLNINANTDARLQSRTLGNPYVPGFRLVTKKPIEPSAEECEKNSRARSAKLRIAERIAGT